mgnify:CR=1 FL=1
MIKELQDIKKQIEQNLISDNYNEPVLCQSGEINLPITHYEKRGILRLINELIKIKPKKKKKTTEGNLETFGINNPL